MYIASNLYTREKNIRRVGKKRVKKFQLFHYSKWFRFQVSRSFIIKYIAILWNQSPEIYNLLNPDINNSIIFPFVSTFPSKIAIPWITHDPFKNKEYI